MPATPLRRLIRVSIALAMLAATGCASTKQTATARTGTEELLLTNAWDRALARVDFRPLTGVPVFLDTTNVTAVDQGYVVSSLREAMLTQGVLLKPKIDQAQYVVEARVGAYGTDEYDWMIGIQQTTIPATLTGVPTGTIPEMPLVKKTDQHGTAKLAMFAYNRTSGQIVWKSGTQLERSNSANTYIGALGPFQSGSIRNGTEFMGVKVPLTSSEGGPDLDSARQDGQPRKPGLFRRKPKPTPAPAIEDPAGLPASDAPMATKTDLDSFRP
jgi:hypothetical protein